MMKFLKRKYVGKGCVEAEWEKAIKAYQSHLTSIVSALPESAKKLLEHEKRRPFHDAIVERVVQGGRKDVTIELEDRRIEFSGVRDCEYPADIEEGESWLYWEMDMASGGAFELRAMWERGDFRVVAKEVRVYDKREHRYAVPDEPPSETSRMFSHRESRRQKHRR